MHTMSDTVPLRLNYAMSPFIIYVFSKMSICRNITNINKDLASGQCGDSIAITEGCEFKL